MKIFCPTCNNTNVIPDDDVSANVFSFLCEQCNQLLSVKIVVEALRLVQTTAERKAEQEVGGNRVTNYIRKHLDEINLPVLPILATRIREAKKNPNCSINDIVDLVKTDQIIASRILALANSAMYGGLVEITDLKRAIIKLGLSVTETLVQALENRRIYSSDNPYVERLLKDLWLHALGTALTAQTIAKEVGLPKVEEIFSAGLLHDFGYVLFIQALTGAEEFKANLKALNIDEFQEIAFEDHAVLGATYLEKHGLPKKLTTIVACHEEIPEEEADNQDLHVVALANQLCKKVGLGPVHDPEIRLELTESAQILGFNELKLADLEVHCEDLVQKVAAYLD